MMEQSAKGIKKIARPALGRGLSALISAAPVVLTEQHTHALQTSSTLNASSNGDAVESIVTNDASPRFLPLSTLAPNPTQPRQYFSDLEIEELANSIRTLGVLQPILVRPRGGTYEIIAGERRFRAAGRAGLESVPVLIRELSDRETLEVALVENVQRQNLNPLEEAKGYQRLIDEFSLTAMEVAEKVGKDRATVANSVRVLRLPPAIQEMLADGRITMGHAKAILTVKEPAAQLSLASKVIDEQLSVRALEAIVSRVVVLEPPKRIGQNEKSSPRNSVDVPYPELEEQLRNSLGTKVAIRKNRRGGVVELHFFSDDEFSRLIEILSAPRE